jgi:hypothetical protein
MPVTVFGEGAVQTAYVSFTALDITDHSLTLIWPTSYINVPSEIDGIFYNVLAASMTVNNAVDNVNTITLPDANQSSVGANFIITNIGFSQFRLLKSDGSELITIPNEPDTANAFWVQLVDNSTAAGEWQFVQFGAGTSQAVASTLAGNGLVALLGLLNTNIPVKSINIAPYNVLLEDRANLLVWLTGTGSMNLIPIGDIPEGYYISVNNEGTGILTISGDAPIDNDVSKTVSPGQSLSIVSDGAKWWTLGFGQNIASSNFQPGSSVSPSITFTSDTTTGIYYYQTSFPPVIPPGIGFSVSSTLIANISGTGLFMKSGANIICQDSTSVAQTKLSSQATFGQLSWMGPGLINPASFFISGTPTTTTMTLGPFAGLSISESATNANLTFNANTIFTIDAVGEATFPLSVVFNGSATFNGAFLFPVAYAVPIANGGTGALTQQDALNALMPPTPASGDIVYYDVVTNHWIVLPIGTLGQVLTVTNVGGNLVPRWA